MLIDASRSQLLVIDLQEKMLPPIADGAALVASCRWLLGEAATPLFRAVNKRFLK
jgi:hypothetical protein